jgi:uncharacterized membrane protein YtjA (UPF0391 family)
MITAGSLGLNKRRTVDCGTPSALLEGLGSRGRSSSGDRVMLYWAMTFLFVAMLAAVLGFGGVAVGSAGIAKTLCMIFVLLCVVSMFGESWSRGSTS